MSRKVGKLHIFIDSNREERVHIVGDEEGLYWPWKAVEEAMVSRKGIGTATLYSRAWKDYRIHVLRVDNQSNFLKFFANEKG